MRILLVEDDLPIAGLVRVVLEGEGFEVDHDSEGDAAVARIGSTAAVPDLVVLDIALPHVDGIQILERIRTNGRWSEVPVVMLTARAQEEHVMRALDAGANDYVAKPFRPDELVDRIRRLLR